MLPRILDSQQKKWVDSIYNTYVLKERIGTTLYGSGIF